MLVCRYGRFEGRQISATMFAVYIIDILVCYTDSIVTLTMLCKTGYMR